MFIGNSLPNFFTGGSGRNILIGGGGADVLKGGGGDSLLIGDSTVYDTNPTALNAIFAEWTRTDLSFEQRVADLISPGNNRRSLNGIYTLDKKNIISDGSPDTLLSGSGLVWAFVTKKEDTFSSKAPRDHVTNV
jgi:Ca2+-binding RTX toxin-like protein